MRLKLRISGLLVELVNRYSTRSAFFTMKVFDLRIQLNYNNNKRFKQVANVVGKMEIISRGQVLF